ncbi:MAG: UDP-N-acetylhexosamine pyrophosphorylase [Pirellulaceae bacterium]|nr:MAG: UDP-N-acetylhexosamine pyrophosphorylase [Pirellulaceae bacterium]
MLDKQTLQSRLQSYSHEHLLQFWDELTDEQRAALVADIESVDFDLLRDLTVREQAATDWAALAARAEPPPAIRLEDPRPEPSRPEAIEAGEEALRQGKVGMILVAGGQGTRLGFAPPKGMFPIGPLSGRTLYQMHADRLRAVMRRYGKTIPLFVMTSPATDAETRAYFRDHHWLGLDPQHVHIFCQGTMPAVDDQHGRLLLAEKHRLALSPDGHGGVVAALHKNRCLQAAAEAGIDYFYYAQVDNPMARLCEPELIGYHILARSQMTTQVVKKRFPTEKVGNVVMVDGKVQIIEYSDLPEQFAEQTNPDGSLRLWAGNIAIHVFDRSFLEAAVDAADALPFHRAHKKVSYVDAQGNRVEPTEPNAIKFERFVFDLLPLADNAIVVEADAAEVFAPVKNANGAAVDTPEQAQQAMLHLHRRWLETAGANVPSDIRVEINPLWALDADEVQQKLPQGIDFVADTYLR